MEWAAIQESQPQHRPCSPLAACALSRSCCPPLRQTWGITKGRPCHRFHYEFLLQADRWFGIHGPALVGHMLTPCRLVLLLGWMRCQNCAAQNPSLPALKRCCSSSPPGQVRGIVPSLGLACAWEQTPQGIHGHHFCHPPPPTLLLTSKHHNMHREWKGLPSPILSPPTPPGDKTDRQGH